MNLILLIILIVLIVGASRLALQRWLGLLSKRWAGVSSPDSYYSAATRKNMMN
jgi:hypothetical protein